MADRVGDGGVSADIAEFTQTLDAEIVDLSVLFGDEDYLGRFDVGIDPPMQSKLVAEGLVSVLCDDSRPRGRSVSDDFRFCRQPANWRRVSYRTWNILCSDSRLVDFAANTYRKIPVAQQGEVLSAIGDIAIDDVGKPACTSTSCSA
jgi:hypothetical protein